MAQLRLESNTKLILCNTVTVHQGTQYTYFTVSTLRSILCTLHSLLEYVHLIHALSSLHSLLYTRLCSMHLTLKTVYSLLYSLYFILLWFL